VPWLPEVKVCTEKKEASSAFSPSWDRYYETLFRLKSFWANFHPLISYKFYSKTAEKCVSDNFELNSLVLWHKKATKTNIYKFILDDFNFYPWISAETVS
jgi:hypothetical protein